MVMGCRTLNGSIILNSRSVCLNAGTMIMIEEGCAGVWSPKAEGSVSGAKGPISAK